ncbi:MAG: dephospho-CoA kinase [Deltaproteobacteria bacterium]|nr:dephospho-CoA kinase [Deltaproteobacteria bacterium]
MKILALTGGIATGKSSVARIFEKLGAMVIDADKVAHQTYLPKTPLYREMLKRYGRDILDAKGRVDRKKLGVLLFRSKKERQWLEERIHPATRLLIGKEIQKALRRGVKLILVEAALHVETDWHRAADWVIDNSGTPAQTEAQVRKLLRTLGKSP